MKSIVAVDNKWGIGKNNGLLFDLKSDMKHFVSYTKGTTVIMGYNTLLSLPDGMPLKNRTNIVLYPQGDIMDALQKGYILATSLPELFALIKSHDAANAYVIGGAMMYRTMLPYCDEAIITKVDADGGATVFYENLDSLANWQLVEENEPFEDNGYTIRYCTYRNNSPTPLPAPDVPADAEERVKRVAEKVKSMKK